MMKQTLIDSNSSLNGWNRQLINENLSQNNGRLIISGVLQRAGAKNQNGRVYPRPILERESKKYKDTFIKEGNALGELDHPETAVVELKNASHRILDIWWEGDDLCGKLEVLHRTPAGGIVKGLLEHGVTIGISSRGLGSVKNIDENTVEVMEDFDLICWDLVSNPSTQRAFMEVIKEGVDRQQLTISSEMRINSIINDIISLE